MEYSKLKDQDEDGTSLADDVENLRGKMPLSVVPSLGGRPVDPKWKRKSMVTLALTVLTSGIDCVVEACWWSVWWLCWSLTLLISWRWLGAVCAVSSDSLCLVGFI